MPEISAKNFLDRLKNPDDDFVVVDVRSASEWSEKKLSDRRMLFVEMQDIPQSLQKIPKEKPVLVLCRSGNRSAMVTEFLLQNGFDAWNIKGGMMEVGFLQAVSF